MNTDLGIIARFLSEVYFQHFIECSPSKTNKQTNSISHSKLNVKCFSLRDWIKKIPNLVSAGILALESIASCSISKFGYSF